MNILKQVLLLVGAIVVAGVVIALVETVAHSVEGVSPFVAAIGGYAAGSVGGGLLIGRFGGQPLLAIVLFVSLSALAGYNLFAFPHPDWFAPVALIALSVGTYIGARFGRRR